MKREELDKRYEQMCAIIAQRIDKDWCNTLKSEDDILRECVRLTENASKHFVQTLTDESEPNVKIKSAVRRYKEVFGE
jgi:hypothetical protein